MEHWRRTLPIFAAAVVATLIWAGFVVWYLERTLGWTNLGQLLPTDLAAGLGGILLPVALIWLIAFTLVSATSLRSESRDLLRKIDALAYPPDTAAVQVRDITQQLAEQGEILRQTGAEVAEKLESVRIAFAKQSQELTGAGVRASSQAEQLREALSAQQMELTEARGHLAALVAESRTASETEIAAYDAVLDRARKTAEEIAGTLRHPAGEFEKAIEQALDDSGRAAEQMADHARAMAAATEEVKGAAVSLRADLEGDSKAVLSAAGRLAREAKAFSDEVQDSLARLTGAFERTTSQADYLKATLDQEAEAMRGLSSEIEIKASGVTERLTEGSEAARETFAAAATGAREMTVLFRAQGSELAGIAERSGQRLREQVEQATVELTALAEANSESFTELAAYAGRKLQQAGELVRPHVESLNAASDRAVEKAERAGQAFQTRVSELRAAAEETGRRVGEVGTGLRSLSAELRETAGLAEQRELEAAAELRTQNEALAASAAGAQKAAGALRSAVEEELARLQVLSGELNRLTRSLQDELAGQTRALQESTANATAAGYDLREEAQAQLADLREVSASSLQSLNKLGDVVAARSEALGSSAEAALSKAGELGQLLDRQRSHFDTSVKTVAERLEEISSQFQQRSGELRQAADEAGKQALSLKQSDLESRRDLFLRSATVMIEDLNSQAIDLTRLFEGEVPEDLWKRHRKGDRSIFARRLARQKDESYVAPKIAERFKEDERFREQATRYINQFESLMSQATACDPEHVLSATFLTADVGKLYLLLSRSLGRTQ